MKLRSLALAAVLAARAAQACAADQVLDLSSGTASFIGTAPLLSGGNDVISFTNLAAGSYYFLFTLSAQQAGGLTATLNGQPATILASTPVKFAVLAGTASAPFQLTLTGTAFERAAYSGELAVYSLYFVDGFETGDTSRWSTTQGLAPAPPPFE